LNTFKFLFKVSDKKVFKLIWTHSKVLDKTY
jgi:hypothetical protein